MPLPQVLIREPYRDPTYIHFLFYLADPKGFRELVGDYQSLAQALGTRALSLEEVESKVAELLNPTSLKRYDIVRQDGSFIVVLHAYEDAQHPEVCILQIVHAPGKRVTDVKRGWLAAQTVPWQNARSCIGSSRLFVVNTTRNDPGSCRDELWRVIQKLCSDLHVPSGYGSANLGFGYLEHLGLDAFMLILKHSEPMPKEAIDFQCVHFPRLEMHRHKANHYARLRDNSLNLVKKVLDAKYNTNGVNVLLRSGSDGQNTAKLLELEELESLVTKSLHECKRMHENAKTARENFERNLRAFIGRPQDPLWARLLMTFDPLIQCNHLEEGQNKLKLLQNDIGRLRQRVSIPDYQHQRKQHIDSFVVDEQGVLAQLGHDDPERWEAVRDILYDLFKGEYQRIKLIKQFGEGSSGALVLLVEPYKDEKACALMVAKIGPTGELETEHENFVRFIDPRIKNYIGRIERKPVEVKGKDIAGIVYTAVGVGRLGEKLYDLEEFIKSHNCSEIQKVLEGSFNILGFLHQPVEILRSIAKEYRLIMPAALEGECLKTKSSPCCSVSLDTVQWTDLEGLVEKDVALQGRILELECDKKKIKLYSPESFIKMDISFDESQANDLMKKKPGDPIKLDVKITRCWKDRLREGIRTAMRELSLDSLPLSDSDPIDMADKWLGKNGSFKLATSVIHGDLNLRNIIVDEDNRPWVIDWAKTREKGHTAFDFAKLETELKLHIVVPHLDGSEIKSVLEQLRAFEEALPVPSNADVPPASINDRFFSTVAYIRYLAKQRGLSDLEYLISLAFYSLSTLKFRTLDPLKKVSAYLLSSLAWKRVESLDASLSS